MFPMMAIEEAPGGLLERHRATGQRAEPNTRGTHEGTEQEEARRQIVLLLPRVDNDVTETHPPGPLPPLLCRDGRWTGVAMGWSHYGPVYTVS